MTATVNLLIEKLQNVEARYEELNQLLAAPETVSDSKKYQKTAKAHSEFGEIVNMDRLQAIVTRAKNSEDGQVAENPGNVVDQDVLPSEEHGRT